jgi:hypothetical protein
LSTAIFHSPFPIICHDAPGRTYELGNELRFSTNRSIILAPIERTYQMSDHVMETIVDMAHIEGANLEAKLELVGKLVVTVMHPFQGIIERLGEFPAGKIHWLVCGDHASEMEARIFRCGYGKINVQIAEDPKVLPRVMGAMAHNWSRYGHLAKPMEYQPLSAVASRH